MGKYNDWDEKVYVERRPYEGKVEEVGAINKSYAEIEIVAITTASIEYESYTETE